MLKVGVAYTALADLGSLYRKGLATSDVEGESCTADILWS